MFVGLSTESSAELGKGLVSMRDCVLPLAPDFCFSSLLSEDRGEILGSRLVSTRVEFVNVALGLKCLLPKIFYDLDE